MDGRSVDRHAGLSRWRQSIHGELPDSLHLWTYLSFFSIRDNAIEGTAVPDIAARTFGLALNEGLTG